jgi:hypothetical protein
MRKVLASALLLLCVACGPDEQVAAPPQLPSTDVLCPPILARVEAADAKIDRLSAGSEEPVKAKGTVREASTETLDKLQKATHEYLRLRTKAAALGCVAT